MFITTECTQQQVLDVEHFNQFMCSIKIQSSVVLIFPAEGALASFNLTNRILGLTSATGF